MSDDCPECEECAECQAELQNQQTAQPMWPVRSALGRHMLQAARAASSSSSSAINAPLSERFTYKYELNLSLITESLRPKVILNANDEGTKAFLERCEELSESFWLQSGRSLLQRGLAFFFSRTTVNGMLFRGSMHVLSQAQFRQHLAHPEPAETVAPQQFESLLDIGAGDGGVTSRLAPFFKAVSVTETDRVMRWRLARMGYRVLSPDEAAASTDKYDVVSCLNVLDRCDKPVQLLQQMKASLKPGGKIVIALVLPYTPFVEDGASKLEPTERMAIQGNTIEENINTFVLNVLASIGLEALAISKTPYLCEGDMRKQYYILNDYMFVARAMS